MRFRKESTKIARGSHLIANSTLLRHYRACIGGLAAKKGK